MAYSTPDSMLDRFGLGEMLELSTKGGEPNDVLNTDRVLQALTDASDTIDSYLRKRYAVPLVGMVPSAIARAAEMLARYDLAFGGETSPSEQMRLARKEVIVWLDGLADGRLTLDGLEPAGDYSGAMTSDRMPQLGRAPYGGCVMPGPGYDPEWPSTW